MIDFFHSFESIFLTIKSLDLFPTIHSSVKHIENGSFVLCSSLVQIHILSFVDHPWGCNMVNVEKIDNGERVVELNEQIKLIFTSKSLQLRK